VKYTLEFIGYENHIQTKSLSNDETEVAEWDIADVWELEDLHLAGEGDFEKCALRYDDPLSICVSDANGKQILKLSYADLRHFSEVENLSDKNWDKRLCVDPEYTDDYENTIFLEKGFKGSAFCFTLESDVPPTKEDFLLSSFCIETPQGDYDLVGNLIFKGEILVEDELESGSHNGSWMYLFKSDGSQSEIT
jgi:hypothetical protein